MSDKLRVEKIVVEKIKFNFDFPPFNKPEVKAKINSLMPNIEQESISFHLKNSNTSTANGLKRIISGELKTKALNCDISDIETDEEFINSKKEELVSRINFIAIDQDLPLNTEFSINIANTNAKEEFMVVRSSELIQISGPSVKNNKRVPFA